MNATPNTNTITNSKHAAVTSISLKIACDGELRRLPYLPFHNNEGLKALKIRLEELFELDVPICLTYEDEDGDTITIGSEEEFQLAVTVSGGLRNDLLRLKVVPTTTQTTSKKPAATQEPVSADESNPIVPLAETQSSMKENIRVVKVEFRERLSELKNCYPAPNLRSAEEKQQFQIERKALVEERNAKIRVIRSEFADTIVNPVKQIKIDFHQKLATLKDSYTEHGSFNPSKLHDETKQAFFEARTALIQERDTKLRELRESKKAMKNSTTEEGRGVFFNPSRGRGYGRGRGRGHHGRHGRGRFARWNDEEETSEFNNPSDSSDSSEENHPRQKHGKGRGRGHGHGRGGRFGGRFVDPAREQVQKEKLQQKRERLEAKLARLEQVAGEKGWDNTSAQV